MKKSWMAGLLACLLAVSNAFAFDWFGGRLSIGGGFGRAKPKLPYSYQDQYQDGDMWTAHVRYNINNDVSIQASYADLEPYLRGDNKNDYRFRPIVASLRYNLFHHLPFTPYITAGAGYSTNEHEIPGTTSIKWDGFTYQAGLGLEFFITEGTSLGAEALYHSFEGEGNATPYRLASLVGMVNFYFGPGPSQRRTEEALQNEKAEAEKARAETEAAKQQTLTAQQQALTAQQLADQQAKQQADAAAAAQAAANQRAQDLQAKEKQAQAELDNIKQMVARKDIEPITFKTGSADLLVSSNKTLDQVANAIKKYPDLKLRVEGHTDNVGGDAFNVKLSQARADAVKNYLVGQQVAAAQITAVGVGKADPIATNESAEGRAQNRRVEFITYIQ